MGVFRKNETTHGSRSSSMSYALRWKHDKVRLISIFAILAIAVVCIVLAWVYGQASKSIHLVIDGKEQTVETRTSSVGSLLDEQSIELKPQDDISAAVDSELKDGDQIVIDRAVKVTVLADGKSNSYYTTEDTVKSVFTKLGVSVSEQDKVYPSLSAGITPDLKIRVVRVNKHTVEEPITVPYQVVKKKDPTLLVGKTKVVQQGSNGKVVSRVEKVFQDGEFVSKRWLNKTVEKKPQAKIIAVGTKKPEPVKPKPEVLSASITREPGAVKISQNNKVTKGGVSFKYKKLIKNVSMTAYSSEESGIGTKTASGTSVTEGRTIAVDPKVIPLGWWVYIEGVGFRRAEDTGGAIKGNKIDVYYDSLKTANKFGRKKGRTVYVIGPTKPELN
ncbi:hypothetical protein DCC85_00140 [Paenibacillus sp. CAA11]|uniref:3D domain-containing protein n=1 Tax=Paenibacillus sp. CAA11 TaxID=1532905 RepID=UPI000D344280|nr:3D domain-containing protein [Paenibacillus sp. CAA11]AWB42803.1 hypothetical protein DCC85_00140 [Paenibacillus sp. CAA11]